MAVPTLVILAGGVGSRYGGTKQLEPLGPGGEVLLEYAVYDAWRAGFGEVILVIRPGTRSEWESLVGGRFGRCLPVRYVEQRLGDVPPGCQVPAGRTKPWGTAQALWSARDHLTGPFAALNADDFYGQTSVARIGSFLRGVDAATSATWAMVGYAVQNTVTDNGSVSRGVCETRDSAGGPGATRYLTRVTERLTVTPWGDGARYTLDGGLTWVPLPAGTPISMNLWGLTPAWVDFAAQEFPRFLEAAGESATTAEFQLPTVVQQAMAAGVAQVEVLDSPDRWYGLTYHEDKPTVTAALARLHEFGTYPEPLWPQS